MLTLTQIPADVELVQLCRDGDREAFRQIVEKYQPLVCALTYSACGDLQASEDLAQTTFVSAWRHLSDLEDPAKLKGWLCGIARNQCADFLRKQRRTPPTNAAESEQIETLAPDALSPGQRAISREEQAMLWRSVAALPESLREPVVLFYRQDQSVRQVAQALDLTEEAVRQRLSRGRTMLRDSLAGFVESALRHSGPTKVFTLGVLAAIPLTAISAKAAIASTAAAKTAKIAGLGSISNGLAILLSPLLLGGLTGWRMKKDDAASPQGRAAVRRFWQIAFIAIPACAIAPILLAILLVGLFPTYRVGILAWITSWICVAYVAILMALILWIWLRRRPDQGPVASIPASIKYPALAMLMALGLLVFIFAINNPGQQISLADAQQLITQDLALTNHYIIFQSTNGDQDLGIRLPNEKQCLVTPMDPTLSQMLKAKGAQVKTDLQGRDYEVFGWPGKLLPLLCAFLLAAGAVLIVKRRKSRKIATAP